MDAVFDISVDNRFGIKYGRSKLVLIKTGRGGTIYGYHDKYIRLVKSIYDEFGYSVVVSANPVDSDCNLQDEIDTIRQYIRDIETVSFVGVSNGALVGAQQGYLIPEITGMVLINAPLMINWVKIKNGLNHFSGEMSRMIYGTKDPSYRYFELLKCIEADNFSFYAYEGADHHFAGMEDILVSEILKNV